MSYDKYTWVTGETVTAAKLNHMEDGIAAAGGTLVITETYDESTQIVSLDKTYAEIESAIFAGVICIIKPQPEAEEVTVGIIEAIGIADNKYYVQSADGGSFAADTKNDYPAFQPIT